MDSFPRTRAVGQCSRVGGTVVRVPRHRNCTNQLLAEPQSLSPGLFTMSPFATIRRAIWTMRQYRASRLRPEAVRRRQEERFRRLLLHAVERSPFYREKYRGIDVGRCAIADLPTTTKAELMANFDRVVTDPAVTRAG